MAEKPSAKQSAETKLLAPIREGGKFSLIPTPLTQRQIVSILQPTPKEHILRREGKGGQQFDYVTGNYIQKKLNFTFGFLWDFEIIRFDIIEKAKQVVVYGKLTVRDPKTLQPAVIKEQFGRADIKFRRGTNDPVDFGNDLKAAATDCLKKCASLIGFASDVYGKEEFKDIGLTISGGEIVATKQPKETKAPVPKQNNVDYVLRLKDLLHKRGAQTQAQEIALLNKLTNRRATALPTSQDVAKALLFKILNSQPQ